MTSVKETHHFYPVLCYFRFTDARYSMARAASVTLEAAALIRTALDAHQFGWVRRSAALEQLQGSARMLLDTLARESRVPTGGADGIEAAVPCRRRFTSAVARLQRPGVTVTDDVDAGVAEYLRLRADWDVRVARHADFLGYTPGQIDVSIERIAHARSTP